MPWPAPEIMSKNKVITTLILCAVLFSTLAGYLIYHYMSPARTTVYIFNAPYSAGEQLTSDMLVPLQVDSTIITAGKRSSTGTQFVTPDEYYDVVRSGDSLRMDVNEGMPLTTSMLSVSGGSTVEMNMRSDSIAITIQVDQYTGITNNLKEGSRVNIYTNQNNMVTLIQQNKRVLEVFKVDGVIKGVAVEETIQESMELVYAATNGTVYLGLVDATGYQSAEGADPTYTPAANYGLDLSSTQEFQSLQDDGGEEMETETMEEE